MPFEPPCFVPEFFFDNQVLSIVRSLMDDTAVARSIHFHMPFGNP
jgi:hypothetical protein